jgi:hypothetical protein
LPSRWSIQARSLFDFERLQWIESDWELMLWKIFTAEKDVIGTQHRVRYA